MIHYFSREPQPNGQCVICWDPLDGTDDNEVVAHTAPEKSWIKQHLIIWHPFPSATLHPIHKRCLATWIEVNESCPMCRAAAFQPEYNRAYVLKKIFRIVCPIVCGMGCILGLYHLIHDEVVAEETAKMNKMINLLKQCNLEIVKNTNLSHLDQQISFKITTILLRFSAMLMTALPFALHGCAWVAEHGLGVRQLISSRLDTTGFVVLGLAIGCSLVEQFNLSSYFLVISATIHELVIKLLF